MNNFQKTLTEKFEGFSNDQLIDIYSLSPDRIVTALIELSEQDLTSRPRENRPGQFLISSVIWLIRKQLDLPELPRCTFKTQLRLLQTHRDWRYIIKNCGHVMLPIISIFSFWMPNLSCSKVFEKITPYYSNSLLSQIGKREEVI